jgi:glycerate kinase
MAGIERLARGAPHVLRPHSGAGTAALIGALLIAALVWAAPSELSTEGRLSLTTFLAAIYLLDELLAGADLVLTAEGGIDHQTPRGKIPGEWRPERAIAASR